MNAYDILNGEKMEKIFDGKKTAKLGTKKKPAVVEVQTEERLKEVASIFEEKGWEYTIGLDPDKREDITDLEILLNRPKQVIAEKKVGRNEPCPCGSGKSIKNAVINKAVLHFKRLVCRNRGRGAAGRPLVIK